MREPTCVIKPITYTSICSSREPTKENPVQSLTHSVSFGKFVSESLAWDRWTMFSSKRYVEEAERFSQPGSVAEKKAFFEAHYQRMAGKKHNPDLINRLDVVQQKPENDENNDKETTENKETESKSNVSTETKKNECVGELDVTMIGSKEEKKKKHGELNSMNSSEGSESSQEALIPKIRNESYKNENPTQKRKTTITWLLPVCISPAAISAKYRSSIAKSDKKAPKSHIPAIAEKKSDPKKSFFLAAQFSKLWSKCRTKLLCAIPSRLGRKDKSARKNTEKIEKKPIEKKARKWFQCIRFNCCSASTNQKEKAQSVDRKKRMAVTFPKLCIKK